MVLWSSDHPSHVGLHMYTIKEVIYATMETNGVSFQIIIELLVSSSRFILIPMLWVYAHYKYFISFREGTVFRRQKKTSKTVSHW